MVAFEAHNLLVAGSIPAPATMDVSKSSPRKGAFLFGTVIAVAILLRILSVKY